jgi:hypothetical protein
MDAPKPAEGADGGKSILEMLRRDAEKRWARRRGHRPVRSRSEKASWFDVIPLSNLALEGDAGSHLMTSDE